MAVKAYISIVLPDVTDPNSPEADEAVEALTIDLKNALTEYDWSMDEVESADEEE